MFAHQVCAVFAILFGLGLPASQRDREFHLLAIANDDCDYDVAGLVVLQRVRQVVQVLDVCIAELD
jgi:hypothetical protein